MAYYDLAKPISFVGLTLSIIIHIACILGFSIPLILLPIIVSGLFAAIFLTIKKFNPEAREELAGELSIDQFPIFKTHKMQWLLRTAQLYFAILFILSILETDDRWFSMMMSLIGILGFGNVIILFHFYGSDSVAPSDLER